MNQYHEGFEQAEKGRPFIKDNLIVLPNVSTTMNYMAGLIASGKAENIMRSARQNFLTAIALRQTAGVGSVDPVTGKPRQWSSIKGNLLFSLGMPVEEGKHPQKYEFDAALAVAETTANLLPDESVSLKWPNDVLVNGQKMCGVLVRPHEYDRSIVNVGVGVNIAEAPASSTMRENGVVTAGTCLKDHGVAITCAEFMEKFDAQFAAIREACPTFTSLMQRIGFANAAGEITLQSQDGSHIVKGLYRGFSAKEEKFAQLHLETKHGEIIVLPLRSYGARADIKPAPAPAGFARRHSVLVPHV